MIVHYDSFENFEVPNFTLCNPGSVYKDGLLTNVIGMLVDYEAEEFVFNFNSTSELNIRINNIPRDDSGENIHVQNIYHALKNRRLIFAENIGYFMISSVVAGFDNGVYYKDITARSIDAEIENKNIPYIANGTYRLTSDKTGTDEGIVNMIINVLPLWEIGHIDDAIANKYRTFEDVDTSTNCLSFLLEKIQDAYECIVIFDIINRKINIYSQDNYVRETYIHLTKEDLINTINVTENSDNLYTAISILGDENVTISGINPLGSNTIYDFSYYLDWMSNELKQKVKNWQIAIDKQSSIVNDEDGKETYYNLGKKFYTIYGKAQELDLQIQSLDTQTKIYERCRDNIVAESSTKLVDAYNAAILETGGKEITIKDDNGEDISISEVISRINNLIEDCLSNIDGKNSELNIYNANMDALKSSMDEISDNLSFQQYFTDEEYAELSNYIFEGSYRDEYIIITDIMSIDEKFEQMKLLYDRGRSQLKKISQPTQEFSLDVENFIFSSKFQPWSEQLETGCLINVELNDNDVAKLFLSNMTINYDDHSLSMTFGNRFNKFDPKSLYENVLGNVTKSANTLNYVKDTIYPIKSGEFNALKEALRTSRNLSMGAALSSNDEEIIIDSSGYTGRRLNDDGEYEPEQIKITGSNIVFTDDAWDSCKTAIGKIICGTDENGNPKVIYGINSEAVIGDLIIGSQLNIKNSDGEDLLTVVDGKIESSIKDVSDKIDGEDGLEAKFTKLKQAADRIEVIVGQISEEETPPSEESPGKYNVTHVKTSAGYTFDENGLTIHKPGEEIQNKLDNKGMYVGRIVDYDETGKEIKEDILTADTNGVNAVDLTARQYLIIGTNSRFEDYTDGTNSNRTACFYIGA